MYTLWKLEQTCFDPSCRSFNKRYLRYRKRDVILTAIFLSVVLLFFILQKKPLEEGAFEPPSIVLWWNFEIMSKSSIDRITNDCCESRCEFTSNRAYLPKAKAIVFYASSMEKNDWPLSRRPNQIWALLHEESPRNKPILYHPDFLANFNFTSTFSRHSDFPLKQFDKQVNGLTTAEFSTPIGHKNILRSKLAPIVYIQSDCSTMTERDQYVRELMKWISIDSYGLCLKNRKFPKSLDELQKDPLNTLYDSEMLRFVGRYKFILSIENGICNDYITEKYWRAIVAGTVPIYFGSPTIRDWQPNNKSGIYISDFETPKDLADFIHELDKNDTEYVSYLQHKYNVIEPITNQRLLRSFQDSSDDLNYLGFFEKFACQVCCAMNSMRKGERKMANISHYDCPYPFIYPPMKPPINSTEWTEIVESGICEARALNDLFRINLNFTLKDLQKRYSQYCFLNHQPSNNRSL